MKMLLCVLIYFSHGYPLFHHQDGPACITPVRKVGDGVNEVAFLGEKLSGPLNAVRDLADNRKDHVRSRWILDVHIFLNCAFHLLLDFSQPGSPSEFVRALRIQGAAE